MSQEVDQILAEVLKLSVDQLHDDLTMDDVETWDSLRHMEMVTSIEDRFGIEFSFDEISAMLSIGDLRRTTAGKLAA